MKVKQFRFEQAEQILRHGIVQAVAFPAQAPVREPDEQGRVLPSAYIITGAAPYAF